MRDWWGEVLHNLSLDFGKFRVYYFKVQKSLNFLSVVLFQGAKELEFPIRMTTPSKSSPSKS